MELPSSVVIGVGLVNLLLLLQTNVFVIGERLKDRMYVPVSGASCFRRLNGTHQTGCSSEQSGSVGVLHLVQIQEDFEFLLGNPPSPPYAPMIPPHLFTRENIMRLKQETANNISVVLLINRSEKMTHFSHELQCPNQYSGLVLPNSTESATCNTRNAAETWNPWGTGLLHEDFPFPIYYIADPDEIDKLTECFEKFNNYDFASHGRRSLCSVQVNTFMSAAVNSEVCIRRTNFINNLGRTKYCDPLEGRNVYATLFPRKIVDEQSEEISGHVDVDVEEKFILVTCRLDTTSMFDGVGLGALDSLLGYATLVSVAHMLAQLLPSQSALSNRHRNVLFVVFNGESYDYIGSQRFVYDLEHMAFPTRSTRTLPIALESIEFMLDIGTLDDIATIKVHTISEFPQSKEFLTLLQRYASDVNYDFNINFEGSVGFKFPPTSAQSFLRKNISFPACAVNAPPSNRFYHSIYDDVENAKFNYANTSLDYTRLMPLNEAFRYFAANSLQMKIRNVSSVIAMALYESLTRKPYADDKLANPLLIDEFLYCFLQSADCPLFKAASKPSSMPGFPIPPSRYISVSGGSQESSGWTYRLLGFLLSHKLSNVSEEQCTYLPYHWFAGFEGQGECRLTTQNYSHALSPAFIIEGYNWSSGEYSTWTESTWSQFSARIFLRPSRIHEVVTLLLGIIVLIISFCLVYIINLRAEVLFEDSFAGASTDALTQPTAC